MTSDVTFEGLNFVAKEWHSSVAEIFMLDFSSLQAIAWAADAMEVWN